MSGLYRVLVVDDEMLIRQGVINYIDWVEEGFQIVGEASNGNEALRLIEELRPHLVITDVVMPGMDGIELVRVVKEKHPEIEIVVLSSFEDFEYVRSTFQSGVADYILKPKLNGGELIKTLRKVMPESRRSNGVAQSAPSMEELLQKSLAGYSLTAGEEQLVKGFAFNHYSLIAVCGSQNPDFLRMEMFDERAIDAFFIPSNVSGTMFVLINFDREKLQLVKRGITELGEAEKHSRWLMSVPFTSIYELKRVYEDHLLKMKDYLFYLTDEKVLIYDALPQVPEAEKPFDLGRFLDLIKQKKFEAAIPSLTEHVDVLMRNYTKDIFEFKSWLENILFNVIVLLGNMNYDVDELEMKKYEYFAEINEAAYAKDAVAIFHTFIEDVKRIVLVEDNKSCPADMKRLLQYIEEHYTEPLSLTTLSETFHFNPSYLSSYFSTHLNIGFSDYLNQVRIVKAKYILETSQASVSMVSEMVGYSDPSYFCKVFKRMEGSSPGNYRKQTPAMN
ncbi:response regulator transcription factor [Halobacillus sp. A5]|uniref:response regulator transcription factor n=1 Tax=Halobacillus sp. A5 TaxID=2880263 RepID=UPI0020A6585F|nr:response regulator transcription factor [Halobacillus sp. A5]MCP3028588.1 response regulator transcription factor [Halobacillus sp. A5]